MLANPLQSLLDPNFDATVWFGSINPAAGAARGNTLGANSTMTRRSRSFRICRSVRTLELLEDRRVLSGDGFEGVLAISPRDDSDPRLVADMPRGMPPLSAGEIFNLQSKPDSNFTIYLDFDGHITSGTDWNASYGVDPIVSPAFDLDGDRTTFGQLELQRILTSWQRTAEDFSPFDVNVTTRDPGVAALENHGGSDTQWGARAVVSVDNFAACGCGGFAYLNSFGSSVETPSFIFNWGEGSLGETFSHEVGHMLGLNHDGTSAGGLQYYRGHGGTGTLGWGPIMGAPFDQNITQWDRGEYFDANNSEDDLQIITTQNGFGYRADDFGNTLAASSLLDVAGNTSVSAFGIIERNTDIDIFSFQTGAGNVSLSINPLATRPDVDVWAGIYDGAGSLVAQSNPGSVQSAEFVDVPLAAGTYFLRVEGIGSHDTYSPGTNSIVPPPNPAPWTVSPAIGYSGYGSLGQYAIHGTVVAPGNDTFSLAATDAVKVEGAAGQQPFTFTITREGNTAVPAQVSYSMKNALPDVVGESYPFLAAASDFVAGTVFNGVVAFAADELTKSVTLNVQNDSVMEQDEYFDLVLTSPSAGWKLANSRATGIILSDESVVSLPAVGALDSVQEGPFAGALIRWRQIGAANGALDEWGLDNVSLANSTFADDFDPGIDAANWTEISNGTARTGFVGGTGNALFMSGGPDRRAVSRILQAQPGDVLTFDLIFGNGSNGGDNCEAGEDVVLEYSLDNGSNWSEIATYDTEDYTTWTQLQAPLPFEINTNPPASVQFTLGRDGGTSLPVTVNWSVDVTGLSNPASADDFPGGVFPSGQVTFAAGESTHEVMVTIQGDTVFEPDERFNVRLNSASGSGTVTVNPSLSTAVGTIVNDDATYSVNPGPQFRWRQLAFNNGNFDEWAIDNVGITGGGWSDDFDPDIDNSQWSSIAGASVNSNFGGSGNSLFFTGAVAARAAVSRPLVVQQGNFLSFDLIYGSDFNGGENPESGEEVVLEYTLDGGAIWTPVNTFPLPNTTWSTKQVVVPPGAVTPPQSLMEGNAGSTVFSFKVLRSGQTATATSVAWSVVGSGTHPANRNDFAGAVWPSGTIDFLANETIKTVQVLVSADALLEPDETFDFVLATSGVPSPVSATILNDDSLAAAGDFNADGRFNCSDIDALVANIAGQTGNLQFDLNGDNLLTQADVTAWLAFAGTATLPSGNPFLPGDATLDGTVDGSDYGIWNSNKFTSGAGWCGGDFDADGSTDGSDYGIWNSNKFSSSESRPAIPMSGQMEAQGKLRRMATRRNLAADQRREGTEGIQSQPDEGCRISGADTKRRDVTGFRDRPATRRHLDLHPAQDLLWAAYGQQADQGQDQDPVGLWNG